MELNNYRRLFENTLFNACIKDIAALKMAAAERRVFAWAIYLPGGFEIFSSAACDNTGFKTALLECADEGEAEKIEVCVDYWNIFEPGNAFADVNEISGQLFNKLYDIEDANKYAQAQDALTGFFCDSIVDVLIRLKEAAQFNTPPFEKDVFTGVQYNSPGDLSLSLMLAISQRVNSSQWHNKLLHAWA